MALGKKEYEGRQTVTISAPLYGKDGLPMFVKAGAIIPMMPEMNYIGEKPVDPLTLDIYPVKKGKSQFALLNRKRPDGKTQKSVFECIADGSNIEIEISNSKVKQIMSQSQLKVSDDSIFYLSLPFVFLQVFCLFPSHQDTISTSIAVCNLQFV